MFFALGREHLHTHHAAVALGVGVFPDEFLFTGDFDQSYLSSLFIGCVGADAEVSIRLNVDATERGNRDALQLGFVEAPNGLTFWRKLRDGIDVPDQGVAIFKPDGGEGDVVHFDFKDDLALRRVFPDEMLAGVTNEVVTIVEFTDHTQVVVASRLIDWELKFEGDFSVPSHFQEFAGRVFTDQDLIIGKGLTPENTTSFFKVGLVGEGFFSGAWIDFVYAVVREEDVAICEHPAIGGVVSLVLPSDLPLLV